MYQTVVRIIFWMYHKVWMCAYRAGLAILGILLLDPLGHALVGVE